MFFTTRIKEMPVKITSVFEQLKFNRDQSKLTKCFVLVACLPVAILALGI